LKPPYEVMFALQVRMIGTRFDFVVIFVSSLA
jgi:hypothetical protein